MNTPRTFELIPFDDADAKIWAMLPNGNGWIVVCCEPNESKYRAVGAIFHTAYEDFAAQIVEQHNNEYMERIGWPQA